MENNTPLSRVEDILQSTIDNTEYNKPPQSRVESLLIELKEVIGGGGSSAYHPAGSVDYVSELPAPSADYLGYVYDITQDFTTTSDFKEGAGKRYPAGSNIAIVDVGTPESPSYKYDVLSGFIDTSNFVEKEEGKSLSTNDYTDAEKTKLASLENYDDTEIRSALNAKANDADLAAVAKSGAYSDLSGTPTIPSKTSDLTNDAGFVTNQINDASAGNNSTYSSNKIVSEISGEDISNSTTGVNPSITDSADGYVQELTVYGKSHVSKNLFDKTMAYADRRVSTSNGGIYASNGWSVAPRIDIEPNTPYVLTTGAEAVSYAAFYQADDTFISGLNWASGTSRTSPANAYKVRFDFPSANIDSVQFEKGETPTPYEPYFSGIKSIGDSGSLAITTANSDSSESSTATLTTGLPLCGIPVISGETYTDGDGVKWLADTASVEGVEKRCGIIDLGDLDWTYNEQYPRFYTNGINNFKNYGLELTPLICGKYEVISTYQYTPENLPDQSICSGASTQIIIIDNNYSDAALFKAAVTGVKLVYPLATPTTQELTPTEKSALLALRTFDSATNLSITDDPFVDISYIKNTKNGKAAEQLADNLRVALGWVAHVPEMHRNIYRGKALGSSVTAAQLAAIADGSFDDLYVGDYWTIPVTIDGTTVNVNWRIADIDYYLHAGDTALTAHHLVIVPDTGLYAARMNATASNSGGYKASEMYTTNLGMAKTAINTAFPDMVLTHRDLIPGNPADSSTWADSTVELLSEIMVYGTQIMSPSNSSGQYNIFWTIAKSQLALFRLAPQFGVADDTYWLRDVVGQPSFAAVAAEGNADGSGASNENGVRPYFLLGDANNV